jgi:endoglucanase
MSYMTSFGWKNPTRVHHRAASIPSVQAQPQKIGCQQGWPYYNSGSGNPNQATGAIVGGPNANDNINDVRSNVELMEPTTYINAPVVGVLAVLATGAAFQ